MQRFLSLIAILIAVAPALTPSARADQSGLTWHRWSDALFDRAARENKYILLHMAAVWCHWCHVMERTTYRDPAIQRRLAERFIAVRVDQDSDPELSYRYENWGWPATIMFDKDGNEIFKRRGYISPELFDRLITAVIEDPSALPEQRLGGRGSAFGRRSLGRTARANRDADRCRSRQDQWRLRQCASLHSRRHG